MSLQSFSLEDRVGFYRKECPKWPAPVVDCGWIQGSFVLGNDYRNKSPFYGAFPPNFLRRIMSMFPDAVPSETVQLFSGSLPPGPYVRVDAKQPADITANAESLPFKDASMSLYVCDPPYSASDAIRYDYPLPNKTKVMREISRTLMSNGYCVWLDCIAPMYKKKYLKQVGAIGVWRSTNHRVRGVGIYRRTEIPWDG